MTSNDALDAAITDLIARTRDDDPWTAFDICNRDNQPNAFDGHVATILNAVFDGRLIRAARPAEAGRVEKLLSKLIYVIEKNIKDDGSDVKTVTLPDGTKHTGPICDLFHAVLTEIASQCRAALTPPPAAQEPSLSFTPEMRAMYHEAVAASAAEATPPAAPVKEPVTWQESATAAATIIRSSVARNAVLEAWNRLESKAHRQGDRVVASWDDYLLLDAALNAPGVSND